MTTITDTAEHPAVDPATEQLAAEYRRIMARTRAAWARLAQRVYAGALFALIVGTLWFRLDPQPGPLTQWVESVGHTEISTATVAVLLCGFGAAAAAVLISKATVARALRPGTHRLHRYSLLGIALVTPACVLSTDPTIALGVLVMGLLVLGVFDDSPHTEKSEGADLTRP